MKPHIHEVIVVEGKNDVTAVLRAVDAVVITTGGFGFTEETLDAIRAAASSCGVVILTDPDPAGEHIRRQIADAIPETSRVKHAHLPREYAQGVRIGIEYAQPFHIRAALEQAHVAHHTPVLHFALSDLYEHGLAGTPNAAERRLVIAERLGLGPVRSARVLLERLNHYGITRAAWDRALKT